MTATIGSRITIGPYAQGEIPDPLLYTFLDFDGNPIPLDDFDERVGFLRQPGATTAVERTIDTTDTEGQVQWTWATDDLENSGTHYLSLWVGDGVQLLYEASFRFYVRPSRDIPGGS